MAVQRTPNTDDVREMYVYGAWERAVNGCSDEANAAEFDRWLKAHDRAVIERFLRERDRPVRMAQRTAWDNCAEEAYHCGWLHGPAVDDMHGRNPYRDSVTESGGP